MRRLPRGYTDSTPIVSGRSGSLTIPEIFSAPAGDRGERLRRRVTFTSGSRLQSARSPDIPRSLQEAGPMRSTVRVVVAVAVALGAPVTQAADAPTVEELVKHLGSTS